jgi:hypothetical protein
MRTPSVKYSRLATRATMAFSLPASFTMSSMSTHVSFTGPRRSVCSMEKATRDQKP